MTQGSWREWLSWRVGREEAALPGEAQAQADGVVLAAGESRSQRRPQNTETAEGVWPSLHWLEGHGDKFGECRGEAVRPRPAWWSQGPG